MPLESYLRSPKVSLSVDEKGSQGFTLYAESILKFFPFSLYLIIIIIVFENL